MTRCRLSEEGIKRVSPRDPNRVGEYLGLYQRHIPGGPNRRGKYETDPSLVCVRWDGTKTIVHYHHDFIEIIPDSA